MFANQAGSLIHQLQGAGMDQRQAEIFGNVLGQCKAPLRHNGPVELNGPLKLNGPVDFGQNNDPGAGFVPVRGTLQEDLTRDGYADLLIANGPVVKVFGYFVKTGKKVPSGTRVGASKYWGDEFFTADVSDDCQVTA